MSKNKFTTVWFIIGLMYFTQIIYILLSHGFQQELQQISMTAKQLELLRGIFYFIAIISFPLTNLIRHIQLRINQTVPSNKPMNKRYLMTVIVSQVIMAFIGLLGFVMFIFGDHFNTLYIFSSLAFLGFFLHRPKQNEFLTLIVKQ